MKCKEKYEICGNTLVKYSEKELEEIREYLEINYGISPQRVSVLGGNYYENSPVNTYVYHVELLPSLSFNFSTHMITDFGMTSKSGKAYGRKYEDISNTLKKMPQKIMEFLKKETILQQNPEFLNNISDTLLLCEDLEKDFSYRYIYENKQLTSKGNQEIQNLIKEIVDNKITDLNDESIFNLISYWEEELGIKGKISLTLYTTSTDFYIKRSNPLDENTTIREQWDKDVAMINEKVNILIKKENVKIDLEIRSPKKNSGL